jgi:hypothetical protein
VPRSGGGKRDRTADLLHAMQALSQLSYTPTRRRGLYGTAQGPANPALPRLWGVTAQRPDQLTCGYFFQSRGRIGGPGFAMAMRITIKDYLSEEWLTGVVLL